MKKKFRIATFFIFLVSTLVLSTSIHAKSESSGSENAGKSNSAASEKRNSDNNKDNSEKNINNSKPSIDNVVIKSEIKSEKKIGKPEIEIKNLRKINKINTSDLKRMLREAGTESAELLRKKYGELKMNKIRVREATKAAVLSRRRAVSGFVIEYTGSLITITHNTQRDRIFNILITSDTLITGSSSTPSAEILLRDEASQSSTVGGVSNITVGVRISAVGDINDDNALVAKRIHVIPGKFSGITRRLPNTITATPSATPTSIIEPTL